MTQFNNGYAVAPSVQEAMRKSAQSYLPGDPQAKVLGRPTSWYHWKTYAQAGFTSSRFFNVSRQTFVTNLPAQSTIEANTGFLLTGINFVFTTGLDIDGAAVSNAEQLSDSTASGLDIAEQMRRILMANSEIELTIGERVVFRESGLFRFPAGGGAEILSAASTTATTTTMGGGVVNNGAPLKWNQYQIAPTPWPILPGQTIELTLNFPTAIALPSGITGVMGFFLNGTLFTKANA